MAGVKASIDALVTFGAQFMMKLHEVGTCIAAVRETSDIADSTRISAGFLEYLSLSSYESSSISFFDDSVAIPKFQ